MTVSVAACGSDDARTRPATQADVRGRSYLATHADHRTFVSGIPVRIGFGARSGDQPANTLGFSGGCNGARATYSIAAGRLRTDEYSTTLVGCDPLLERQDQWLVDLLAARPEIRVSNDRQTLVLRTADDTVTFVARPAQTTPLGASVTGR